MWILFSFSPYCHHSDSERWFLGPLRHDGAVAGYVPWFRPVKLLELSSARWRWFCCSFCLFTAGSIYKKKNEHCLSLSSVATTCLLLKGFCIYSWLAAELFRPLSLSWVLLKKSRWLVGRGRAYRIEIQFHMDSLPSSNIGFFCGCALASQLYHFSQFLSKISIS